MRKYIVLFFSVSLLLCACHKNTKDVIRPAVMVDLLTDIHLADGEMTSIPQIPDSVYKYGMAKYLQIFKRYDTDSAQFRLSYKYYTMHPDELVSIYDKVLKKLIAKSDSVTALIAKNNTAQMKNNKPGGTAGGKIIPHGSPPQPVQHTPMRPTPPPLPARPNVPGNNSLIKQQMMERLRMRRDSAMRNNLKMRHAVSVK